MNKIKIIIGLGNKDKEYEKTYHNVGFLFVDYFNEIPHLNPPPFAKEGGKPRIEAVKTGGFMNQSGDSVKKILKKGGLKIEEALIVHDDSDIYLGDYKISRDRGAAGHKGVEHIMAVFGTKDFTRLRIGIRPKRKSLTASGPLPLEKGESSPAPRMKADAFVLKNISATNRKVLERVFEEAMSVIPAKAGIQN